MSFDTAEIQQLYSGETRGLRSGHKVYDPPDAKRKPIFDRISKATAPPAVPHSFDDGPAAKSEPKPEPVRSEPLRSIYKVNPQCAVRQPAPKPAKPQQNRKSDKPRIPENQWLHGKCAKKDPIRVILASGRTIDGVIIMVSPLHLLIERTTNRKILVSMARIETCESLDAVLSKDEVAALYPKKSAEPPKTETKPEETQNV